MDTSGIIIFARHSEAQSHISKQFIERISEQRIPSAGLGNAAASKGEIDVPCATIHHKNPSISSIWIGINALPHTKYENPCTTNCVRVRRLAVSPLYPVTGAAINYAHAAYRSCDAWRPHLRARCIGRSRFDLSPRVLLTCTQITFKTSQYGCGWMGKPRAVLTVLGFSNLSFKMIGFSAVFILLV